MALGGEDTQYTATLEKIKARKKIEMRQKEKEAERQGTSSDKIVESGFSNDEDSSESSSEDEVVFSEREKDKTINLQINKKDLLQETALTAKRVKLSTRGQTMLLANVLNLGGADLKDVTISKSSAQRVGKKAIVEGAKKVRDRVRKEVQEKTIICGHFDGKVIMDITEGKRMKNDRIAIKASYQGQEQLLGVVVVDSSSGENQKEAIVNEFKKWDMIDNLSLLSFDTTSDNTGKCVGACTLIEKYLNRALVWLACRHHVVELRIKHVAKTLADDISERKSNSPEEKIFNEFKSLINQLEKDKELDLEDTVQFDWENQDSSVLADQAKKVLQWAEGLWLDQNFSRGDYKELLELVLYFLGSTEVPA